MCIEDTVHFPMDPLVIFMRSAFLVLSVPMTIATSLFIRALQCVFTAHS